MKQKSLKVPLVILLSIEPKGSQKSITSAHQLEIYMTTPVTPKMQCKFIKSYLFLAFD